MTRVCSGFSPSGYLNYGKRFMQAFDANMPEAVELAIWVEEPVKMPRGACRDLWEIPGATALRDSYTGNPVAQGLVAQPVWKHRERLDGYSFRSDAAKFWKQILIPQQASLDMADGDILVWLDADVVTTHPVPAGWFVRLLGDADVVYLGRTRSHSEIGFWAVRLGPDTRKFLADIAAVYTSGAVFDLPEWHSAFVWDHVRRAAGLAERNLCGPHAHGHVWPGTELARYTRHDKGPRKGTVR